MFCVNQYTNKYIKDCESKFKAHAKAFEAPRAAAKNDAALAARCRSNTSVQ